MGYRTVVVLYNDQASEWENDPELGKKIAHGMNGVHMQDNGDLHYGKVVECTHADTQTLAVVDGYNFQPVAYEAWNSCDTPSSVVMKLLRAAAKKMGYRLVKDNKFMMERMLEEMKNGR